MNPNLFKLLEMKSRLAFANNPERFYEKYQIHQKPLNKKQLTIIFFGIIDFRITKKQFTFSACNNEEEDLNKKIINHIQNKFDYNINIDKEYQSMINNLWKWQSPIISSDRFINKIFTSDACVWSIWKFLRYHEMVNCIRVCKAFFYTCNSKVYNGTIDALDYTIDSRIFNYKNNFHIHSLYTVKILYVIFNSIFASLLL